jgi:hypothetical protein
MTRQLAAKSLMLEITPYAVAAVAGFSTCHNIGQNEHTPIMPPAPSPPADLFYPNARIYTWSPSADALTPLLTD